MEEKENKNNKSPNESKDKKKSFSLSDQTTLEKEILDELNTNPKYGEFLNQYSEHSVDSFKKYYAMRKAYVMINGARALEDEEYKALEYSLMAEEYIWHIQQRKLFDLQCRWRAEQVKIKEIEAASDFNEWSEKIEMCPFITPITKEEFELYMSFVDTSKMEDIQTDYITTWQEYEDFKAHYTDIESDYYIYEIPGWYEYYENKTGLGSLYLLNDIRGEKEEFYREICRANERKKNEEAMKDKPKSVIDRRPYFDYYNSEVMLKFLSKFEDGNFIIKWQAYINSLEAEDDPVLEYAIETLQNATEDFEINYNRSWRAGIIAAANEYKRKRLLEELPKAYNDYQFRLANGLGFKMHFEKRHKYNAEFDKKIILDGRELNGEPRDFNF